MATTKAKKEEAAAGNASEESTMSLTIVDSEGEVMDMSAFSVDTSDGIKMLTGAREWRAMTDKAAGYFDASGDNKGATTKMRIIGYRKEFAFFGTQYGEDEMEVIQVLFIDEDNVVSSIVFMKSGAEEFKKMIDNIMLKKKPVVMFEVTAGMEKKTTKANFAYHLVTFKAELMEEARFKEVVEFVKTNPHALKMWKELPRK